MTKLREWMAAATLVCLWACGSPEQATVDLFFRAALTDDNQTLASMSARQPSRAGGVVAGGRDQLPINRAFRVAGAHGSV